MKKLSIIDFGNRRVNYKNKYNHDYTSSDELRNAELKLLCSLGTNFQQTYERIYISTLLYKIKGVK